MKIHNHSWTYFWAMIQHGIKGYTEMSDPSGKAGKNKRDGEWERETKYQCRLHPEFIRWGGGSTTIMSSKAIT